MPDDYPDWAFIVLFALAFFATGFAAGAVFA